MSTPVRIWREAEERYQNLGKKGKIISFTKIFNPPKDFFNQRPYWAGIIEFTNGKKITTQLVVEDKKPEIGQTVVGVLRRIRVKNKKSIIEYGVKFKVC